MVRNKKTGKIINGCFVVCEYKDGERFGINKKPVYDSLSKLNEDWEDYTPQESIIKYDKIQEFLKIVEELKFSTKHFEKRLKNLNESIEELCGEEEE